MFLAIDTFDCTQEGARRIPRSDEQLVVELLVESLLVLIESLIVHQCSKPLAVTSILKIAKELKE